MNNEVNDAMRNLLEAIQLIVKDRTWNNEDYESKAKITSNNITKILEDQK